MVSRHQVTDEVVDEGRVLICLKVISSSWVMIIRLRARPASGDFSSSPSRSSAAIRVFALEERVEDKHWISSSSAMVWEKGVGNASESTAISDRFQNSRFNIYSISNSFLPRETDRVWYLGNVRMLDRQRCLNLRLYPSATSERARQLVEH